MRAVGKELLGLHRSAAAQHEPDLIACARGTVAAIAFDSAIADERRVRVQHRHQLLEVARGTGVPELSHDFLRLTTRRVETRTRVRRSRPARA